MKRYLFLTAAINCLCILVYAQTPDDFSFKETYKISTPAEMVISTNDGFINVNSNGSNEIEVFYIVKKNNRIIDIELNELEEYVDVDVTRENIVFLQEKNKIIDLLRIDHGVGTFGNELCQGRAI